MNAFLKKIVNRFKHSVGPNPVRDWFLLVGGAGLLLVASVLWNVWFFSHIEDTEVVTTSTTSTLEAYPAGAVKEIFESRASTSVRYREAYPFIDPSR